MTAVPKDRSTSDIWCDFDGDPLTGVGVDPWVGIALDGRETYTRQTVLEVPGWILEPAGVHAPSMWVGGHVEVYEEGVLTFEGDFARSPGLTSRRTCCLQVGPLESDPGDNLVVWDPLWLFFPPPAIPPAG